MVDGVEEALAAADDMVVEEVPVDRRPVVEGVVAYHRLLPHRLPQNLLPFRFHAATVADGAVAWHGKMSDGVETAEVSDTAEAEVVGVLADAVEAVAAAGVV